ncbi:hypothetical protein BC332_20478 [Capsicum chinense]|nr:hypothetical protein BC332_20478 [Capsicum chinense]
MSVEDLIVRLRIKEDNKAAGRSSRGNSAMNRANIVEDDQNNSKKQKKTEHENCSAPKKRKNKDQANLADSKKETDDLCAMLSECNLVGNPREWWMDSGAIHHVYANKELFLTFTPA